VAKKLNELEEIRKKEEYKAAEIAYQIWIEGVNVIASDHPYLKYKQTLSFGLKRAAKDYQINNSFISKGSLLISIVDINYQIVSLQIIYEDNGKFEK
jgi:hypothetical protein